ncbi:S41 family peptidase [Deinococcus hopiensis]|uniref:S41 family peptidase n=1 Tax=Deinococcus hopiensis TaxID=309885 RepID=UPI002481B0FE|nr:S41 family peptidase [Deinococcus hopiensis]
MREAQGAVDAIIDLRNNGGGDLREYVGAVAAFSPTTAKGCATPTAASPASR